MQFMHHCKKTFLSLWKGLIICLLIIIPFLALGLTHPDLLSHLNTIIAQHWIAFTLFRWAIIITIFLIWPILSIGEEAWRWSTGEMYGWLARRLRIMIWFFLLELIIDESNFLGLFHHWK